MTSPLVSVPHFFPIWYSRQFPSVSVSPNFPFWFNRSIVDRFIISSRQRWSSERRQANRMGRACQQPWSYVRWRQTRMVKLAKTHHSAILYQLLRLVEVIMNVLLIKVGSKAILNWCIYGTKSCCYVTGPRLNIKTVLSTYGDFHVKDKTAVRTSYL